MFKNLSDVWSKKYADISMYMDKGSAYRSSEYVQNSFNTVSIHFLAKYQVDISLKSVLKLFWTYGPREHKGNINVLKVNNLRPWQPLHPFIWQQLASIVIKNSQGLNKYLPITLEKTNTSEH